MTTGCLYIQLFNAKIISLGLALLKLRGSQFLEMYEHEDSLASRSSSEKPLETTTEVKCICVGIHIYSQ